MSALTVTVPADAARLQTWWFDAASNQLTFMTDTGIQPRAQLIYGPTRIVIDLPNTTLSGGSSRQAIGGPVNEVRTGQFDSQTTRIVIELGEGYTVDPQQVQVRGIQGNQWVVQLPAPAREAGEPSSETSAGGNQVQGQGSVEADTQLEGIIATGDGFLIKLNGPPVEPMVEAFGDRQILIDLPNTSIAAELGADALPNNRYSVQGWDVAQLDGESPQARITLNLGPNSPDWRVLRNQAGLILLPPRGVSITSVPDQPPTAVAVAPPTGTAAEPEPEAAPISVPEADLTPIPPAQQPTLPPQPESAQLPVPSERVVVVIDPGHGGRDPGAVGRGGLQEKQVIFPISMRVRDLLESQGVAVVMTRYDDRTLGLQPRVDIAERADADIFVSIHANAISLSRPDVNGIESYYASAAGQQLAATIHASMLAATGMNDRGIKQARFFVIRRTSMPATLLEVGFVTGAQDAPRLADANWRETMANAIARGILQYIQRNF